MEIRCYLAMTATEIHNCEQMPKNPGWMACHFSSYGVGLSNLPQELPPDAMIILNDRIPIHGHDPQLIKQQLSDLCQQLSPSRILLDLQHKESAETAALVAELATGLPCPVGVPEAYAADCENPVFLSPCPVCTPLQEHLAPWSGREIWLDIAPQAQTVTVDEMGSTVKDSALVELAEPVFCDESLCCRYHTEVSDQQVIFHLQREQERYLALAEKLGVTCAVGLYQELCSDPCFS